MATDFERLLVHLDANFAAYEAGLSLAVKYTDRDARKMEKRLEEMSRRNEKMLARSTRGILGTLITAATIKEVGDYADAWTGAVNNLSTAGLAGERLKTTLEQLFADAQRGGVEIGVLSGLRGDLAQVQRELDATDEQLQRFSGGVALALRVEGKPASQTAGAITQLAQALGSGVVRAEEFNSINEQARPILQAVAKGLKEAGGSVAKLRNLVIGGKVSSKAFFAAFLAGMSSIEDQADAATETIAQGFTRVDNALTKYIGEADQASGATQVLVSALNRLADNFEDFADTSLQVAAIIAGALVGRSIAGMVAKIPVAIAAVSLLRIAFAAATGGAAKAAAATGVFGTVISTVTARVPTASAVISGLGTALNTTAGRAVALRLALLGLVYASGPIGLLLGAAATAAVLLAMNTDAAAKSHDDATKSVDDHLEATEKLTEKLDDAKTKSEGLRRALLEEAKASLKAAKAAVIHAEAIAETSPQSLAVPKTLSRTGSPDGRQLGLAPVTFDTDDQGRLLSRSESRSNFIAANQFSLEKAKSDVEKARNKYEKLKIEIEKQEKEIEAVSLKNYPVDPKGKKTTEKLNDYEREAAAIKKRTAALITEAAVVGKSTYEAEKARVTFRLLQAAREADIPVTEDLKAQIDALAEGYGRASAAVETMRQAHEDAVETLDDFRSASADALGGFIKDLKNGVSAAEAFANALDRIADKLIDMAVEDLVATAFGRTGTKGGGLFGALFGSLAAPTAHSGGVAGVAMGPMRRTTAAAFAGAQKFHSGGVARGSGDIPALLRHGEPVFTPEQAATLARLGDIERVMTREQQSVHVTVGVVADGNGTIAPYVESVSQRHTDAARAETRQALDMTHRQMRGEVPELVRDAVQRGRLR